MRMTTSVIGVNSNLMFEHSTVDDCKLLELPEINMERGCITSIGNGKEVPFDIKRIYFLFGVPHQSTRGGHAHKALRQLIVAMGGAFDIELFDGHRKRQVRLDRPNQGLLIVPGIWRELKRFSACSTCFVMASELYDDEDYVRDLHHFREVKNPQA